MSFCNLKTVVCTFVMLLFGCFRLAAQEVSTKGAIQVYPSERGNLLSILPKDKETASSEELLKSTAYFKINRAELLLTNKFKSYQNVGQTKRSKTVAELRAAVTSQGINGIQKIKNLASEASVQHYLATEYHFDSLLVLGFFSHKYLEAFGIAFNDTKVEEGVVYSYQAIRVDKSGKEELWAETKIVSKVPNPQLNGIKIVQDTIISNDSTVVFKFHADFPIAGLSKSETFPAYAPINTRLSAKEQKKRVKEQNTAFVNYLNSFPIEPSKVAFSVYYQENQAGWKLLSKYQAMPDTAGVFRLGAFVKTTPEAYVEVRIIPETFGGVTSDPDSSEVVGAYAISQSSVPLIYAVSGQDSTDCIKIKWQKLPSKPYYYGVLIERAEGNNEPERLSIASNDTDSFIDYKIKGGSIYTYQVKALFNPKQNVAQRVPATTVLSGTTFSAPLPPYNLRIDTASKKIPTLKWDAVESNSRFGFVVYRGTKPDQLSHLGNVVKGTEFTDSTGVFSARVKMYYAVVAQNLSQDTSDFSNVVAFKAIMPLDIAPPMYLNYKLANGDLFLDWPEMRAKDKLISGYRLERRSDLDTVFKAIGPKTIATNFFTDTTFKQGYYHEYRIASVADDGQIGNFSMAFEVDFPKELHEGVSTFSLRNTTKGVLIQWPSAALSTTKEYVIYRNDPPKAQLRKLATVPAGNFEYNDKTVNDSGAYLYAMTIVAQDGRESQKSKRKSLKRSKPTKL